MEEGLVPQTRYWAIVGDEFVGRISIRHYLNENLKKDRKKASELFN